eukprot:5040981-Heterocapsa_arctica.AAC.1
MNFHFYGLPRMHSLVATSHASLLRAANVSLSTWRANLQALIAASGELLPLIPALLGHLGPAHWDSTPLV